MNNKKTLKLIRNVLIIVIIILIFLYLISVYYLNYIGLFTCFISVIIIIFIISYLNREIFRLEYLEEIFICSDEDYLFWKDEIEKELDKLLSRIAYKYDYELEVAKKRLSI